MSAPTSYLWEQGRRQGKTARVLAALKPGQDLWVLTAADACRWRRLIRQRPELAGTRIRVLRAATPTLSFFGLRP